MRVDFSARALRQLDRLFGYIADRSNEARAAAYVGRIVDYSRGLADSPHRGTRRDYVLPGLRTIGFEHRVTIAFTIGADSVLIEGIFYGGQDYEAALKAEDTHKEREVG